MVDGLTTHKLEGIETIKKFVLAGNCKFTLKNEKTENRFTFKFKKNNKKENHFFVSVLVGSNNTSDYDFIGSFFNSKNNQYKHSQKSRVTEKAQSVEVVKWFINQILNKTELNPLVSVYHEGKCGRCGRTLTVPESVETGLGPECVKMVS